MLADLGLPTVEMRCPNCGDCQQVKLQGKERQTNGCVHCRAVLVIRPVVKHKPNNILITLNIVAVTERDLMTDDEKKEAEKQKIKPKLEAV